MELNPLLTELERRWLQLFARLAAGDDAPPSQRLRLEGMMEAAALLAIASADQLQDAMAAAYLEAFGRSPDADLGDSWRRDYPFPQVPAMAKRAPVYPGTREDGDSGADL
jgi:hypothetical protein